MKKSLKSIVALLLALSMLLCFAACGDKGDTAQTTAATTAAENGESSSESEETLPVNAVPDNSTSDADTTLAESGSEFVSEEEASTQEVSTVPAITQAPATQAEILALYNSSVNTAFNSKVGFYKERVTDKENLDAGVAFKAFKSLVYKFMGIGADNKYTETVTKGKWESEAKKHYLRKSTLAQTDITNATCTKSGANYLIVISVKGGSSVGSASKEITNAPIDKCGICVGTEDKGYYDHKTGAVIYDAIDDTFSKAVVNESYSNAKITATVDGATGHLVKIIIEYDIKTSIDTGSIGAATATGTTHITYSNFKY